MAHNKIIHYIIESYRIDVGISHQFVKSNTSSVSHKQHRESSSSLSSEKPFKSEIRWTNVLLFIGIHLAALYGFYLGITQAKWATFPWGTLSFSLLLNSINSNTYFYNLQQSFWWESVDTEAPVEHIDYGAIGLTKRTYRFVFWLQ